MTCTPMKSLAAAIIPACLLVPALLGAQGAGAGASGSAQGQAQVSRQGGARAQAGAQGGARAEAQTPASASAQARIDAALEAAARAEVPAELVRSKVREGEAKRVPPDRIAAAVEARVASLVRASETMKRAGVALQSVGELAVTADALDAGVSQTALLRLAREASPERRTVAIAVLSDLVRLGAGSADALARVSAAATSSAALANLQAELASQLTAGGLSSTLDAVGAIRLP